MYLKKINLRGFRNYVQESWIPHKGTNLIIGKNAQGKTNLLEAIYLGTSINSFRTNRITEIINWHGKKAQLYFTFAMAGKNNSIFFEVTTDGKKLISVNGKKMKPGRELPYPKAVVFTPDDLDIIKGNPARRRKYIDFELGPLDFHYHYYYRQYQKALFERNSLLRKVKTGAVEDDVLETWNWQLVDTGSHLLIKRLNLLNKLVPLVKRLFQQLTGSREKLEIKYLSSIKLTQDMKYDEVKERFLKEISSVKEEECLRGQSLKGPHRDEIVFYINDNEARHYGSRGQQRTIVIALKLALLHMWKKETGEYPILLLDDVLQELDFERQESLLSKVHGQVQTFLTTSMERLRIQKTTVIDNIIYVTEGKLQQEV